MKPQQCLYSPIPRVVTNWCYENPLNSLCGNRDGISAEQVLLQLLGLLLYHIQPLLGAKDELPATHRPGQGWRALLGWSRWTEAGQILCFRQHFMGVQALLFNCLWFPRSAPGLCSCCLQWEHDCNNSPATVAVESSLYYGRKSSAVLYVICILNAYLCCAACTETKVSDKSMWCLKRNCKSKLQCKQTEEKCR